jgi:starvation-inducible DNA-binding protein
MTAIAPSPVTKHPTRNDLPEETRARVIELLSARLADAVDLQLDAKQAHWNVRGPGFIALHELFDRVVEHAAGAADLLAERIAQLGGVALGSARVVAGRSELEAYPATIASGSEHVKALADVLATFGARVRAAVAEAAELDDAVTADVCTEIARGSDKLLWFVEAHSHARN